MGVFLSTLLSPFSKYYRWWKCWFIFHPTVILTKHWQGSDRVAGVKDTNNTCSLFLLRSKYVKLTVIQMNKNMNEDTLWNGNNGSCFSDVYQVLWELRAGAFQVSLNRREGFTEEGLFELHCEEWGRVFLRDKQAAWSGNGIFSFRAFRKTLTKHLTDTMW